MDFFLLIIFTSFFQNCVFRFLPPFPQFPRKIRKAENFGLYPKDMNPKVATQIQERGTLGNICLTHVTLSSDCKTGNPPPPPTHTQHYASTQTSITQTQHNTVRIIIFPKHVLIQNLQASIRVEGEGPWPKLW